MAVRTYIPWRIRLLALAVIIGLMVTATLWAYEAGKRVVGNGDGELSQVVDKLRATNQEQEEELARLRSLLSGSESSLQIEQSAQKLLSEQNSALVAENSKLKEDLAVFERLAKVEVSHEAGGVSLDRVNVRPAAANVYYYSFLIALQGDRRGKETMFDLQLVVAPQMGSGANIVLPASKSDPEIGQYQIALRNFRRIEGRFKLPDGYAPGKVEFKILEGGKLAASKIVSL